VQLLGDLLYRLTGASGKTQVDDMDDEEGIGTEEGRRAILEALGKEKRDAFLAGLYILRSDVSLPVRQVRPAHPSRRARGNDGLARRSHQGGCASTGVWPVPQSSVQVWKRVVSHTPRTIKEVLPVMILMVVDCLASASYDRQQMGARTLGDLVRRLGDRVLPDVMPILMENLSSPQTNIRQGVCIGLHEIMSASGRAMVRTAGRGRRSPPRAGTANKGMACEGARGMGDRGVAGGAVHVDHRPGRAAGAVRPRGGRPPPRGRRCGAHRGQGAVLFWRVS